MLMTPSSLAVLALSLSLISFQTTLVSAQTSSEFIGCLDPDFDPLLLSPRPGGLGSRYGGGSGSGSGRGSGSGSGLKIRKKTEKRSYYECAATCQAKDYAYSYFKDKGKGVHDCACSNVGPDADNYSIQPVGSFGCRMGQTRVALTATDHHFIVCSKNFIGTFEPAGTFASPAECFDACAEEQSEGALFTPLPSVNYRYAGVGSGFGFKCRCGGVTSVKNVAACGDEGAEFSYVYKPQKKKVSGNKAAAGGGPGYRQQQNVMGSTTNNHVSGNGNGKAGSGHKGKKVYENPCDDPDSILGYCGFGEEDQPVFHDRTNL
ncbi:hypothetical protein I316_02681 [Kwoniella heveanensis BCC8398]|uniref:WSC domain-containing protein n=1 Tax=Kwoniella heveanensis BCC8398 TaxID=1296120 RepID=A0A1B9GX77_9TREE|nr:hypothetical protein I316_02681 [Kwoniella heveanensis BCC8398]